MSSLPPRIAIFGTFDVENYGDLLFPLVARQRLSPAGVEVVAVSPTDGETRYRDAVRPISQAKFASMAAGFDGILIGGGNIVHLRDFALPGYGPLAYPSLWAGSTALAVQHGLQVIWNAPGVLAPQSSAPPPDWIRKVVAAADRFAVRDTESAEAMEQWSGRRPSTVPDTALDLPCVWSRQELARRADEIRIALGVPSGRRVVALHVKERSLAGMPVAAFAGALSSALEACGAVAVLLAIGRCHGDHEVAKAIHLAAKASTFDFADADSLRDIAAVIAGCDAYLGASLHGHITAAAYGVPARVVAVPALHKFAGQAALIGRSSDVVAGWEVALAGLSGCLAGTRQFLPDAVTSALDSHWSEVARLVSAGRRPGHRSDTLDPAELDKALAAAVLQPSGEQKATRPVGAAAPSAAKDTDGWDRARIDAMIAGGDFKGAAAGIAEALGPAPGHLPARLAEVRLALAMGETSRAVELSGALWVQRPQNPWVWLAHLQCLVRSGSHAAAELMFRDGVGRPDIEDQIIAQAAGDLLPAFPLAQQVEFLRASVSQRPDNTALQLRLAMRAHANGNYQLALDVFRRIEKSGPLPAYAARARKQLLSFEVSADAAVEQLSADVKNGAADVETLCRLCRFAATAGRFDVAEAALRKALELHPLEWRTLYRLNRVFLGDSQDAAIFDRLAKLDETAAPNASWRLQYVLFALRTGHEVQARQALTSLLDADVVGPTARTLIAAIDALDTSAPRRPEFSDDHVTVVRQPGARGTIVVFGGLIGGLSYLGFRQIDRLLAQLPAHVVYLRDPYGRAFLQGIPHLGAGEAAMHSALSRLAGELGTPRVITMGGSASGYAALRAGLAIGANSVISLAGFATPAAHEAGDQAYGRQALDELFNGNADAFDMRPALRSHPEVSLIQVVGGNYAPDMERAHALRGIGNVDIHVLPGVDTHHVALPAVASGLLKRLLDSALSQ